MRVRFPPSSLMAKYITIKCKRCEGTGKILKLFVCNKCDGVGYFFVFPPPDMVKLANVD